MNLTLNLTPETEARLRQQASLSGRSPEQVIIEALQEKLALEAETEASQSPATRLTEFRAWLASHPSSAATVLDDSRESIYGNRGE